MNDEDAFNFIVDQLRENSRAFGSYGYEVYLPKLWDRCVEIVEQVDRNRDSSVFHQHAVAFSPHFLNAAWELCRRGILRPGIRQALEQATEDGSAGNGYTITPFGRTWLDESDWPNFVPTEPERFGHLLAEYRALLGPGFQQRAQEAVRCYGSHAYLACCAMCGAAAESILLAIAIARNGDESSVLSKYRAAGGRSKVENLIVAGRSAGVRNQVRGFTSLLNYWRDETAHGLASEVDEVEAYTALATLLRFAQYTKNRWEDLAVGT